MNLAVLKKRAITSVFFVCIMLSGILYNFNSFVWLFFIIQMGCLWEYFKLIQKINSNIKIDKVFIYCLWLVGFIVCRIVSFTNLPEKIFFITLILFLFFYFVANRNKLFKIFVHFFGGYLYISISIGLLIQIAGIKEINHITLLWWKLPLFIILSIWLNDSLAYLSGSIWGKTSLSKISPNKTWEGTIIGIVLSSIIITITSHYWINLSYTHIISISLITCIVGTLGDLLESKLKRLANVKDSGNIMPGHGGFLDRFDSILLAVIAVWLYLNIFVR